MFFDVYKLKYLMIIILQKSFVWIRGDVTDSTGVSSSKSDMSLLSPSFSP